MCNNPNLDLVNINAYTKFSKTLSFGSQDIERKPNSELPSVTNVQKRYQTIVNNNAYTHFW